MPHLVFPPTAFVMASEHCVALCCILNRANRWLPGRLGLLRNGAAGVREVR
jgi:hypothetical protein